MTQLSIIFVYNMKITCDNCIKCYIICIFNCRYKPRYFLYDKNVKIALKIKGYL